MSHIAISGLAYAHPGGEELFSKVSFRVAPGRHAALVGVDGVGKSTLLRILAGELEAVEGEARHGGRALLMRQDVGLDDADRTVRGLLTALAPPALRRAGERLAEAERRLAAGDETAGMALGEALGRYELEAAWDSSCRRIVRAAFAELADRPAQTLSGGERKQLVLDVLLGSDADVLLLDEPDNFLDVPAKLALERRIHESPKTILMISHDRAVLTGAVDSIVTLEGRGAWVHGEGYGTYPEARRARQERMGDAVKRWHEEERRLREQVRIWKERAKYSDVLAPRERDGDPLEAVRRPRPAARARARPGDLRADPWRGLGPDRAPAARARDPGARRGRGRRVARAPLQRRDPLRRTGRRDRPEWWRQDRVDARARGRAWGLGRGWRAAPRPARVDRVLHPASDARGLAGPSGARYRSRSRERRPAGDGGACPLRAGRGRPPSLRRAFRREKARLEVLVLELEGHNLLLLDEPTDNLDIDSSEALEAALEGFAGTVVAISHDRAFLRSLDRFLMILRDGTVLALPSFKPALEALLCPEGAAEVRLAKPLTDRVGAAPSQASPATRMALSNRWTDR